MKRLDRFEYLEKLSFPSCKLWLWEVYNSQLFLFLFLAGELLHIVYGDLDMAQFRLSGLSSSYSADTVFSSSSPNGTKLSRFYPTGNVLFIWFYYHCFSSNHISIYIYIWIWEVWIIIHVFFTAWYMKI